MLEPPLDPETFAPSNPFMAAIIAEPDDDLPRLIFADHLQEQGSSWGEFIRLQIEHAQAVAAGVELEGLGCRYNQFSMALGHSFVIGQRAPLGRQYVRSRIGYPVRFRSSRRVTRRQLSRYELPDGTHDVQAFIRDEAARRMAIDVDAEFSRSEFTLWYERGFPIAAAFTDEVAPVQYRSLIESIATSIHAFNSLDPALEWPRLRHIAGANASTANVLCGPIGDGTLRTLDEQLPPVRVEDPWEFDRRVCQLSFHSFAEMKPLSISMNDELASYWRAPRVATRVYNLYREWVAAEKQRETLRNRRMSSLTIRHFAEKVRELDQKLSDARYALRAWNENRRDGLASAINGPGPTAQQRQGSQAQ